MTTENSQSEIAKTLSAICNPLAKKYRKMRRTIEGWQDHEIQTALYIVEKLSPLDLNDADFCEAEYILREALDRENAKRIAKNAPWLRVSVEGSSAGRQALCVSHDDGVALWKEFSTDTEAIAAMNAVFEFLQLEGRAANYSDHRPASDPDLDSEIPF